MAWLWQLSRIEPHRKIPTEKLGLWHSHALSLKGKALINALGASGLWHTATATVFSGL